MNGILLALLARHRTGAGQAIDISLLDSIVSTLTYQAMIYFATGESPTRMGTRHPSIVPYECFETKDGYANIGVANEKHWGSFCAAMGLAHIADDPRFATMAARLAHHGELRPVLQEKLSGMTRAEVVRLLNDVGVAVGPVNTVAEALAHPQIQARDMVAELTHPDYGPLKLLGIPIRLSDTPGRLDTAPPLYGEHNAAVLQGLGFTDGEIAQLTHDRVLRAAPLPARSDA
jgi:formyl-CoA transferase/CoA:oxalate CoA-transferase